MKIKKKKILFIFLLSPVSDLDLKICNHGKIPAVLFEYFDTAGVTSLHSPPQFLIWPPLSVYVQASVGGLMFHKHQI